MNGAGRNLFVWLTIGILALIFFQVTQGGGNRSGIPVIDYSEFVREVSQGNVDEVMIREQSAGKSILGRKRDGKPFSTFAPQDNNLISKLESKSVRIKAGPPEEEFPSIWQLLFSWFPILLLVGLSIFSLRQIQSGGNKALGFGRSRARLMTEDKGKATFEDVAGIDEAKEELHEVVDFLKDPQKFQRLGGRIPKGLLLVGPPGTGKTLLARAVAGEANVPFFTISGSDFVEMFVGVGASRVRDMFEQAKKNAPCIVFIDEIDAVGRHRGAGLGGGNDEREQTLNQLLVEMDGFESTEGVILIAATNRPDVLDPALLRPGRFDRQVVVSNPDLLGREKILRVHVRKVPLAPSVDLKVIARGTPGFSGADLQNLVNEAALMAARKGKLAVTMSDLEQAKDKVMMGAERRSMVMSDAEKRLTAYHEGGHALVAFFTPDSDPIHKATIIPRGRALGLVMRLPESDRISVSRIKLLADLKVAAGGRVAEELIFGKDKVTTGASSDIRMATEIARRMVTEWGMSDALGFQSYGEPQQEVFLGHAVTQSKPISESTAQKVDQEVHRIVDECYQDAYKLIKTHIKKLHLLAENLLERETLTGDDIKVLMEGGDLPPLPETEETVAPRRTVPSTHTESAPKKPARRATKKVVDEQA